MKPMLASNYDESKLVFPLGAQPKIDGVRGLNLCGQLTGRSLKTFKNKFNTEYFSNQIYMGLDGELAAERECHPDLCRLTTSAMNRIDGNPYVMWHIFDLLNGATIDLPYGERYSILKDRITNGFVTRVQVVPMHVCKTLDELLEWDNKWLAAGYEGTIIRDLNGMYKQGRSTVREGGLLRIKRFTEEEALVLEIIEGRENLNEERTNELGNTYRTSHQDNQVPNGLLGSMRCRDLKTDLEIIVSAGSMPHDLRKYYFNNQSEVVGHVIKYKCFPKGVKDLPRFPTYQSHRAAEDMS